MEFAIRLHDLFTKWTAECTSVEEVAEKMVIEQLLNAMPSNLRIWVTERKPKSGQEAGMLADDYVQARCHRLGGMPRVVQDIRKHE